MSSHPGCSIKEAVELAEYLRDIKYQPEQVQDFYPTPGTLSTTMFYTGLDPLTMQEVHVPKTRHEKAMQRALLQYKDPMKYDLVYSALVEAGREDLIGFGENCLIKPRKNKGEVRTEGKKDSLNNERKSMKNHTSKKDDYKKAREKAKGSKDKNMADKPKLGNRKEKSLINQGLGKKNNKASKYNEGKKSSKR
ncbi:hypothetical protein SDC9_62943 [bioreactor metagenome]|uniref:UPF0313 domain-containing protein n=1 Tax=bioreactor metagenome TaxID=1076179 RepID=A0A644XK44_9ZZZZ